MSDAAAQVPDVRVEVVYLTREFSPISDHVFEEMDSVYEPYIVPIGSNSWENSQSIEKEISLVVVPRMSTRSRNSPKRFVDFLLTKNYEIMILEFEDPTTYKQALISEDAEKWLEAMRSKMTFMFENQVWDLVDWPDGVTPIGWKWVFKVKTNKDRNIQVYKARLVAKGSKQVHGINYDETISPVEMLKSIRILLMIVTFYDYKIW